MGNLTLSFTDQAQALQHILVGDSAATVGEQDVLACRCKNSGANRKALSSMLIRGDNSFLDVCGDLSGVGCIRGAISTAIVDNDYFPGNLMCRQESPRRFHVTGDFAGFVERRYDDGESHKSDRIIPSRLGY